MRREGKRDTILTFSELRHGTPLAAWLSDKLAPHTPPLRPSEPAPEPHTRPVLHNATRASVDPGEPKVNVPEPDPSPRPTSDTPPAAERPLHPPWFDEHSSPEIAASIAFYLGPAAPNAPTLTADSPTAPSVRASVPTGPPSTKSDPDTD